MGKRGRKGKNTAYKRYPIRNILIYNGATVVHYIMGGAAIALAYELSWLAYLLGALYLAFAFVQMYVIMPLKVCPNCVYYRLEGALCTSALNVVSRRIAKEGRPKDFSSRGEGVLCHNNVYLAALFLPLVVMMPGLVLHFSLVVLALFLGVLGLLIFRFLVIFPRTACGRCLAKKSCPNAEAMGLSK